MDINNCIQLTKNYWYGREKFRVAGFIWRDGLHTGQESFIRHLSPLTTHFSLFTSSLFALNGQFSIIVDKGDEIWMACCPTWSYPLFYHWSPSLLSISDDPCTILALLPEKKINRENRAYFLNFGVTPHSETLISGIQQVRPGEIIRFNLKTREKEQVLKGFGRERVTPKTEKETGSILQKVFEKFSGFLKDKKVLVPLTGGYDSRLIACMLKATGHPRVTCATWGRSGNPETTTAEKVSRKLGFPYVFVPTDDKLTEGFWRDDTFNRYIDWSGHFSSMPYLQDFFAIRYLQEARVIDDETVVLPGHPGDFLRGSHLYRALPGQSAAQVIESIIDSFGTSLPLAKAEREAIRKAISAVFFSGGMPHDLQYEYERWDHEERQSKFIGNSSQVYPFFGIHCMMPLFDKELLEYFLTLPFEQRLGAKLYNKTLENLIFKPYDCDFDLKPAGAEMKLETRWKSALLKILPSFLKEWYYPVKDDAFYREITRALMRSDPLLLYRNPLKSHYYNSYLTQWYRYRVENQLSPGDSI